MKQKFPLSKTYLPIIILVTLLVLFLPIYARFSSGTPVFPSDESYYHLGIIKSISSDNFNFQESQISSFHYFMSFLVSLFGDSITWIITILLGLASTVFFFLNSKILIKDELTVLIATALFILSPIFLFVFSIFTPYSLVLFLFLLFVFAYLKKSYFSIPLLMLISITDFSFYLLSCLFIVAYYFYSSNLRFSIITFIPSVLSLLLFSFSNNFLFLSLTKATFSTFFTSFGVISGISFFYLFMALLGLFLAWSDKKYFVHILFFFLLIFSFSLFNVQGKIALNILLCFFSAILIVFLSKREWVIVTIKHFTLLLIFCGIIFSTSLQVNQLILVNPTNELFLSLDSLKITSQNQTNILSHPDYGHMINYFSNKESVFTSFSGSDAFSNVSNDILKSRDLSLFKSYLDTNSISFILITDDMRNGLVWSQEDEGILFLIKNTPDFRKTYSSDTVEIWSYDLFNDWWKEPLYE